jgi:hypothetical protein
MKGIEITSIEVAAVQAGTTLKDNKGQPRVINSYPRLANTES